MQRTPEFTEPYMIMIDDVIKKHFGEENKDLQEKIKQNLKKNQDLLSLLRSSKDLKIQSNLIARFIVEAEKVLRPQQKPISTPAPLNEIASLKGGCHNLIKQLNQRKCLTLIKELEKKDPELAKKLEKILSEAATKGKNPEEREQALKQVAIMTILLQEGDKEKLNQFCETPSQKPAFSVKQEKELEKELKEQAELSELAEKLEVIYLENAPKSSNEESEEEQKQALKIILILYILLKENNKDQLKEFSEKYAPKEQTELKHPSPEPKPPATAEESDKAKKARGELTHAQISNVAAKGLDAETQTVKAAGAQSAEALGMVIEAPVAAVKAQVEPPVIEKAADAISLIVTAVVTATKELNAVVPEKKLESDNLEATEVKHRTPFDTKLVPPGTIK